MIEISPITFYLIMFLSALVGLLLGLVVNLKGKI